MSQLSADSPWFTFTAPSSTGFRIYSFSGTEEVHKPYECLLVPRLWFLDLTNESKFTAGAA